MAGKNANQGVFDPTDTQQVRDTVFVDTGASGNPVKIPIHPYDKELFGTSAVCLQMPNGHEMLSPYRSEGNLQSTVKSKITRLKQERDASRRFLRGEIKKLSEEDEPPQDMLDDLNARLEDLEIQAVYAMRHVVTGIFPDTSYTRTVGRLPKRMAIQDEVQIMAFRSLADLEKANQAEKPKSCRLWNDWDLTQGFPKVVHKWVRIG